MDATVFSEAPAVRGAVSGRVHPIWLTLVWAGVAVGAFHGAWVGGGWGF